RAHAGRIAVVASVKDDRIISRGCPTARYDRPVAHNGAVIKLPPALARMAGNLSGEVHGESRRDIGVARLYGNAQRAGDCARVKLVAAYRRWVGPRLAVYVHAACVKRIASAATGRAGAEMQ